MLIYELLRVTALSFLFRVRITTSGRIVSAIALAFLRLHCFLDSFLHYRLNGGR